MSRSPIHTQSLGSKAAKVATVLVLALVGVAAFAATAATASAGVTNARDVDGDGRYDTALREGGQAPTYAPILSWLSRYDVGAKCNDFNAGYPYLQPYEQLTIRPPVVWPLTGTGRSSQPVAWRALFVDGGTSTLSVIKYGAWVGATAPTEFGGLNLNNINSNDYYAGSESFTHPANTAHPILPYVQVAWLQTNGTWVYSSMRVNWVLANGYSRAYYGNC